MHKKTLIFVSFLLLAAMVLTASGMPAYAQTEPSTKPLRTVNVTGEGKVYLTPDIAYISIGVHTEDKDAAKAVSSNNAQSKKVLEALRPSKSMTKTSRPLISASIPNSNMTKAASCKGSCMSSITPSMSPCVT